MLAEAGADDEEIDSERFCGAPRVLSRVARDLMTIPNQKERALSALAALARFDAVDGAAAKELLAALKSNVDGPAAVVARVAGLALAALAPPLALQGVEPCAFDEGKVVEEVPAFASVKDNCTSVAAPLLNLGGAVLEPAVEALWRASVMLGGDPADAFATAAPGVRIWAKGRAAERCLAFRRRAARRASAASNRRWALRAALELYE